MNRETKARDWTRHWGMAGKLGLPVDRVPVTHYTSQARFEEERERIFRKAWIPVARESEVANPGDFIKCAIPPLQTEALIVRGRGGDLNAFHNTCLHRGSMVASACRGNTGVFVCPYHAWSFGLDGKLRAIPGKENFPQIDMATARLKPIAMGLWNGFIFLNFADEPEQSLTEYLGDFAGLFDGLPVADYPHMIELTRDFDANWKSLVEASSESYHVASLHRRTLGPQMLTADNPLSHQYDLVFSPPHATATVEGNKDWAPDQPVLRFVNATEAFRAQPGGDQRETELAANGPRPFLSHPAVNRIGLPSIASECMLLFPFSCLQFLANRYVWFQYWPVSADKTLFVMRLYSQTAPSSYREAFAEAHGVAYTRDIVTEDGAMVAQQHRGFKSGGVSQVVFGENEPVLRYFHQMIQQRLAGDQACQTGPL